MVMSGMLKLIYSSAFDSGVDVAMRIIEDPTALTKSAGTVFGIDYDKLRPDDQHVGIHVTALGAFERYGANRNGDSFPKLACVRYHDTFVKHGALFRHHRNKDREKNLGSIKASAWNPEMDRIELFVHAHKERAGDELTRLEKEGEIPFSMACKVAFDRCNRCNTIRKNGSDPRQCDHVKYELGKMADDGTVTCTHNDEPDFFDISFVGRPADRIAWHLKVAAGELIDSIKLADAEGLWTPDYIAIESSEGQVKLAHLKRLVAAQQMYYGWFTKQASIQTPKDRYFYELRKAAGVSLSDEVLTKLREYEPAVAFNALARSGVILDVPSFFKYAMGDTYSEIAPLIDTIAATVPVVLDTAVKQGDCQRLCNDCTFDVAENRATQIPYHLLNKLAAASLVGPCRDERIIAVTLDGNIPKFAVDKEQRMGFNIPEIVVLAEKYAAYKLSALTAVLGFHKDTDVDSLIAVAATQNLAR
jgi:hypothetical protein